MVKYFIVRHKRLDVFKYWGDKLFKKWKKDSLKILFREGSNNAPYKPFEKHRFEGGDNDSKDLVVA